MEKIKLINSSGKIIERNKDVYEQNVSSWTSRGFKPHDDKTEIKPDPTKKKIKKKKSK